VSVFVIFYLCGHCDHLDSTCYLTSKLMTIESETFQAVWWTFIWTHDSLHYFYIL